MKVSRIDLIGFKHASKAGAVGVVAHASDDGHQRTHASGGDGLVGALAAGVGFVGTAEDGFAGLGEVGTADDEVHVERAEDTDAGF